MKRLRSARLALIPVVAIAVAVAAQGATARSSAGGTLVIDRSFEIKTADPQRAFEPTASIVNRAVFDTLLTYKGADVAHPVPQLAESYTASKDAKTFTFKLKKNVHFADGTPLTSADVVFSFNRLINLKGNPSFLLADVSVAAKGKYGVVLKSKVPNTALPAILANTSLGIVNSKLVKAHGGTDAADADKTDKAEQWFNSGNSVGAGSGPYVLKQYSTTSQLVLQPNAKYWGPNKAKWSSVVVRNMISATQLINIQRGSHEVAIDLASDQAQGIRKNKKLKVSLTPSTWVFWLFANNNKDISQITPNKHFQNAVRYAIDYRSVVGVAGPGAIQAPGIIPNMFLGSLPQKMRINQNGAKAKWELAASAIGSGKITLEFPSDLTINGVPFASMAQKVQANLQSVGFNVELAGAPVGTWLQKYRDGKMAFGLSLWGPDYPDPADYLAFLPGKLVGTRAGWPAGSDPPLEKLGDQALVTTNAKARQKLYQQIQQKLNADGPFFPLIQPTQVFVATTDLKGAVFNPVYQIDVTQVSAK
ncbi:MAG: ABC transporter substrate-binding protein [Actinobacteria bacterium]|nr:MAG: ABC transporter substrate-binding protein [Actinomycetota bacterium]